MEQSKQIEIVYEALHNAQKMIELAYRPEGKEFCSPCDDITDEKIKEYYYDINTMCIELSDRNAMNWQKDN